MLFIRLNIYVIFRRVKIQVKIEFEKSDILFRCILLNCAQNNKMRIARRVGSSIIPLLLFGVGEYGSYDKITKKENMLIIKHSTQMIGA